MPVIKVIIQSCYGGFEPTPSFTKAIKDAGYTNLWSIEARTDEKLIKYVEENYAPGADYMLGKKDYMYITVQQVDTDKPWYISNYDGSESIKYVNQEAWNKHLNYYGGIAQ